MDGSRIKQKNQRFGVTSLRREIAPAATDMTNPTVAGVDLGDSSSLAAVLSPSGDVIDRFAFKMSSEGDQILADRLPEGTEISLRGDGGGLPIL